MSEVGKMHKDNFLFYSSPDGRIEIEAYYKDETVWLTQAKMAELFNVQQPAISKHLNNIFEEGEVDENSVVSKMEYTATDGKNYKTKFYNLDAIISVGYRVNSLQATAFRKWATTVLREYAIKGFVMDDERLKNGTHFGKDYFDELLERVQEIRISERRLWLKVTDIFALASDYDKTSKLTREFFKFVQNQLHYAITEKTAPEIIVERADKTKDKMGLTSWKQMPDGKVLKTDITVAKNYLNKDEMKGLQLAVTAFLDIAEARAHRGIPTTMDKWLGIMGDYLKLNEYPVLVGAGKVSRKDADEHALKEYAEFRIRQDKEFIGDFEKEVKKVSSKLRKRDDGK